MNAERMIVQKINWKQTMIKTNTSSRQIYYCHDRNGKKYTYKETWLYSTQHSVRYIWYERKWCSKQTNAHIARKSELRVRRWCIGYLWLIFCLWILIANNLIQFCVKLQTFRRDPDNEIGIHYYYQNLRAQNAMNMFCFDRFDETECCKINQNENLMNFTISNRPIQWTLRNELWIQWMLEFSE